MEAQELVANAAEVPKLVPIPQLLEDFPNYDEWEHAFFFHLSYYNLTNFVADHITPPRENNEADQIQHESEYLRRYHAYAVIFSSVRDLMPKLTKDSKLRAPYTLEGTMPVITTLLLFIATS